MSNINRDAVTGSFPQISPWHNTEDNIWVIKDIEISLDFISKLNPEVKDKIEELKEKIYILISKWNKNQEIRTLVSNKRNNFFQKNITMENVDKEKFENTIKWMWKGIYTKFTNYLQKNLYEEFTTFQKVRKNLDWELKWVNTFIKDLDHKLSELLKDEKIVMEENDNEEFFDYSKNLNGDNFYEKLEKIWEVWCIKILEKNIWKWELLDKIIEFSEERKSNFEKDDFHYWDYRNIIRLAETKQKMLKFNDEIEENEKEKVTNVSLSWWWVACISQLWALQKFLDNWWKIWTISWTSMWAIFAVFIAKWIEPKTILNDLKTFEVEWKKLDWLKLNEEEDLKIIKDFFRELAHKYGITDKTDFESLKNPVVINASRLYKWWEQEMILWWKDKVIDSILASTNINWNLWWDTEVDWIKATDYWTNQKWNLLEVFDILWVDLEKTLVLDSWYSSDNFFTTKWQKYFKKAYQRDFLLKEKVKKSWWKVTNINIFREYPSFDKDFFDVLFEEWKKNFWEEK